jgi:hypothetical protein
MESGYGFWILSSWFVLIVKFNKNIESYTILCENNSV